MGNSFNRKKVKQEFVVLMQKDAFCSNFSLFFKGALSCLREFLATESPLKMVKKAFYVTLKAFFVLEIFKFLW